MAQYHHLLLLVLMASAGLASSDVAADEAECADKLIGLATCLPYVGGESKAPTPDCCTGYKQVTASSIKCLCVLVKDRNDPTLGLKIDVNRAISLPSRCNVPTNVSTCTKLLNLPPGSSQAKEFQHFEDILEGKTGNSSNNVKANPTGSETGPASGSSGGHPSSDGRRVRLVRGEMWAWCLLLVILLVFVS